ncbi:MAG: Uma2 family endonuclease, partial [Egibacteraceae bacterium]
VVTGSARMAHALLERLEAEGTLVEGLRCEILNGELVIRGVPLVRHARVVRALVRHLAAWNDAHGGEVFTEVGVEIGDQQLVPDVVFMGPERAGEIDADGFHVPPDLVVEVTSPGTRSLDLHEKRDIYQTLGVGEYWVVDLAGDVVVVHRRDEASRYALTEAAAGTLTALAAPGLQVPVAELLAAHPPPQQPAPPPV